jgi:hypothetical protein
LPVEVVAKGKRMSGSMRRRRITWMRRLVRKARRIMMKSGVILRRKANNIKVII